MEVENPGIFKLKCCVKNYDWGKIGRDSSVAQLYSKNSGEEADDFKPYAEFWMGTHESGPSYAVVTPVTVAQGENEVASSGNSLNLVNLKDWIEQNPSVIGDKVLQKWGHSLPFLFKVCSPLHPARIMDLSWRDLVLFHFYWEIHFLVIVDFGRYFYFSKSGFFLTCKKYVHLLIYGKK